MISTHTKDVLFVGGSQLFQQLKDELAVTFSDVGGALLMPQDVFQIRSNAQEDLRLDGLIVDIDSLPNHDSVTTAFQRARKRFPLLPLIGVSHVFDHAAECEQAEARALDFYKAGLDYGHTLSPTSGTRVLAERFRWLTRNLPKPDSKIYETLSAIESDKPNMLTFAELVIDASKHSVSYKGQKIAPTAMEFSILYFLALNPDIIRSRNDIMDITYPDNVYVDDRTVDSHIKRLRKKLRSIDCPEDMIETKYGVGYAFKPKALGQTLLLAPPRARAREIAEIANTL